MGKGIGFLYINKKNKITSLIHGGGQERGLRGGTENTAGIVGLAKAIRVGLRGRSCPPRTRSIFEIKHDFSIKGIN